MSKFKQFLLMMALSLSENWADQHQFEVILDNSTIEYVDDSLMDFRVRVVKVNEKNGLNFIITPKADTPDKTMITVEGFRSIGNTNDYHVRLLLIKKPLKDAIQMELFDVQTMLVKLCRPPFVWPIQKGVTYRINGWVPNSTKFPANLPSGKWLLRLTQTFQNETKNLVLKFYGRIEYFKSNKKN